GGVDAVADPFAGALAQFAPGLDHQRLRVEALLDVDQSAGQPFARRVGAAFCPIQHLLAVDHGSSAICVARSNQRKAAASSAAAIASAISVTSTAAPNAPSRGASASTMPTSSALIAAWTRMIAPTAIASAA